MRKKAFRNAITGDGGLNPGMAITQKIKEMYNGK